MITGYYQFYNLLPDIIRFDSSICIALPISSLTRLAINNYIIITLGNDYIAYMNINFNSLYPPNLLKNKIHNNTDPVVNKDVHELLYLGENILARN